MYFERDRSDERKWLYAKKKARSRRYPADTITDTDYADDLALLVNTPSQTESQLHSLEHAEEGNCLHGNANKAKYK